ncbi:hypothetical protein ACM26V_01810 [Salipaludibacillus sp. HK11]|uniref:TcaA NTF2-like domain-containing protein n=1 Tax=Salipaludibacillus sp. HK11 TaxID=3394320 RepID=UPI0039FD0670
MKKVFCLWLIVIPLMIACDEEEVWKELEDENLTQELVKFMHDYKEVWEESLTEQSYSLMETFFVGNSQVFHMERKQHQQLMGERKIEKFQQANDILVETNQFDEFRVHWNETVEIEQLDSVLEETRDRRYYISEGNSGFRITAIERSDD